MASSSSSSSSSSTATTSAHHHHQHQHVSGTYIGHKGRSFDIRWVFGGSRLMSSSEDGSVILWDTKTKRVCHTLVHNKAAEALRCGTIGLNGRVNLFSCGSDGDVVIWQQEREQEQSTICSNSCSSSVSSSHQDLSPSSSSSSDPRSSNSKSSGALAHGKKEPLWKKLSVLAHGERQVYGFESLCSSVGDTSSSYSNRSSNCNFKEESASGQSSSLPVDSVSRCVTIADETCSVWDLETCTCISAFTFENCNVATGEGSDKASSFGGPRNPDHDVYLFDVKKNPLSSNVIAVARSDNHISLLDVRDSRQVGSLGQISTFSTHPTAVSWKRDGLRLLISLGSGEVAEMDLRQMQIIHKAKIHQGACFGASYYEHRNPLNRSSSDGVDCNSNIGRSDSSSSSNSSSESIFDSSWIKSDRFISWSSDGTLSCSSFTATSASSLSLSSSSSQSKMQMTSSSSTQTRSGFYSIYSVDVDQRDGTIALGGGYSAKDSDKSTKLLGTPVFIAKSFDG